MSAATLAFISAGASNVLAEEPNSLEETKSVELKYQVDEAYEWNIHSEIDFGENKGFNKYVHVESNKVAVTKNILAEGSKLVIRVKGSGTDNAFTINNGGSQTLSYSIGNGERAIEVNDTVLEVAAGTNEGSSTLNFSLHTRNFGGNGTGYAKEPAEIAGSYNGTVTYTAEIERSLENYTGYYADVDGNGTVDGVIFADLAFSKTGTWDAAWENPFSYSAIPVNELKEYEITQDNYSGKFGDKPVLSPVGEGKDRFYVMALEDFGGNTKSYKWYNAAVGKMNDFATTTSEVFGSGKANTTAMINKWNAQAYGSKDYDNDIWGAIQTQANNGWFVPSAREWSAFNSNLGITIGNFASFGISGGWTPEGYGYWSSTQSSKDNIYYADYSDGRVAYSEVPSNIKHIRLATTF